MRKIGLCLSYRHTNYGTELQAYATQVAIRRLGYETEIIRYKKKKNFHFFLGLVTKMFSPEGPEKMRRLIQKKIQTRRYPKIAKQRSTRNKLFHQFADTHFVRVSPVYHGYKALCAASKNYDAVVVGSDQLWLPIGLNTNFYNLMFVADDVPKISYATSFGVSKIPPFQKKQTRAFLARLDAISVRESSGKAIINALVEKEVQLVADPTLLLSPAQWDQEMPCDQVSEQPYIFCYFLGNNVECRQAANEFGQEMGMKIVTLRHLDEFIPTDEEFGNEAPYDISPVEFIDLIRNAAYVCTDSFHGTVFSILYHKQFVSFYRFLENSTNSRNTRVSSLLTILGLTDRIYQQGDILAQMKKEINYDSVDNRLDEFRKKSLKFLETALRTYVCNKQGGHF